MSCRILSSVLGYKQVLDKNCICRDCRSWLNVIVFSWSKFIEDVLVFYIKLTKILKNYFGSSYLKSTHCFLFKQGSLPPNGQMPGFGLLPTPRFLPWLSPWFLQLHLCSSPSKLPFRHKMSHLHRRHIR